MKTISLLVYEEAVLASVSGVIDLLMATNQFVQQLGRPAPFRLELVSEKGNSIQLAVPAQFLCSRTLDEATDSDLIIVPAFYIEPEAAIAHNKALIDWLADRYAAGTEIASMCVGSFFLAEAGLLTGKTCASHWKSVDEMRQRYPDVHVLTDTVMTDHDRIYTSGGALLSWNLVLYLIEKFCGRDICIGISRLFNIDLDRVSQSYFAVFQGQRQHEDEGILRAQTYIETNFHLPLTVEQIAEQANMSKRNFIRRFKQATQNTPQEYLQRVKVESAKKALEKDTNDIATVMYDVGYNDAKTFRKVFRQVTGLTPQAYRRKYNRTGLAVA
ncbi:MmsAB operon regulatory protein [Fibrella aestuarina BUZ 2]|uniref:MmsAB operon regulatory protein n=1 Tax=Fibrella aestuarina BUZ 2 TaxID=1166018 RepID=I0K4Q5_9BACT|nr:helix-turn-helix domain-containing protein [Fibrella aestuarina]CCG99108.1 MmsAB operon regulatory protein [Fibrella aestuarina BUZ 2]